MPLSTLRAQGPLPESFFGMPFFHPIPLMNDNKSAFSVNLGHLWHEIAKIRRWMNALLQGVRDESVRPYVDKVSFAQTGEAQAYIEARKNVGKVVLKPSTQAL